MVMTAGGYAKLIEECGELSQVAGKRLAYFYTDDHPDGAGPLTTRIEAEMGDVIGAIRFVALANGLSWENILTRADMKRALFETWHAHADNNEHGVDRLSPHPARQSRRWAISAAPPSPLSALKQEETQSHD